MNSHKPRRAYEAAGREQSFPAVNNDLQRLRLFGFVLIAIDPEIADGGLDVFDRQLLQGRAVVCGDPFDERGRPPPEIIVTLVELVVLPVYSSGPSKKQ